MRKPKAPHVQDNAAMRRLLSKVDGSGPFGKMVALGQDYQQTFDGAAGRRVLMDLLRQAGILEVGFVPGDRDAVIWNDGRSSLGKHIMTMLRWSEPELLQLALQRTADQLAEAGDA